MNDLDALCQNLQSLWDTSFPLVKAMHVRVEDFDGHTLTIRAPLDGNTNVHGTAFAGSLYTTAALASWSLLYLKLTMAELPGSIVHASGNIDFERPVIEDIVATSSFSEHEDALAELAAAGRVRLAMTSEVTIGGVAACRFRGDYVVRLAET